MADSFAGVPVKDARGQTRDLPWLRERHGDAPRVSGHGWRPVEVVETSGPMSAGVWLEDEFGDPIADYPVWVGGPWGQVPAKTDGTGRVTAPTDGSYYNRDWGATQVNFIAAQDESFRYDGIGWVHGTNHDAVNVRLRKGNSGPVTPPPVTPLPPIEPPTGDTVPVPRAVLRQLVAILQQYGG